MIYINYYCYHNNIYATVMIIMCFFHQSIPQSGTVLYLLLPLLLGAASRWADGGPKLLQAAGQYPATLTTLLLCQNGGRQRLHWVGAERGGTTRQVITFPLEGDLIQ